MNTKAEKKATRPYFVSSQKDGIFFEEKEVSFRYYPGFSSSQKKKCVLSMHEAILEKNELEKNPKPKILEISTKSDIDLGIRLSAFNLKWKTSRDDFSVESLYQGSKVFRDGGPYTDLFKASSLDAKRDERLKNSGDIRGYKFQGEDWDLNPPHMFYDYLYIKSLKTNPDLCEGLMEYDTFTDIEFSPKKSLYCQARAAALFVSLRKKGLLDKYLNKQLFSEIYDGLF